MKQKLMIPAITLALIVGGTTFFGVSTASAQITQESSAQKKNKIGNKKIGNKKIGNKKIGMTKARAIALERAAGKIESAELENEHGKTIYSFDIRNSKGTVTEVQVEAYTGEVVSVEEENAAAEAAEKKQEVREKRKH